MDSMSQSCSIIGAMGEVILEIMPPRATNGALLIDKYIPVGGEGAALYVAPTQRKAREARSALSRRLGGALLGDVVVTLDSLIRRISTAAECGVPLSAAKRRVLIEDALNSGAAVGGDFRNHGMYPGIATSLSSLMEDIKLGGAWSANELKKRASRAGAKINSGRLENIVRIYQEYEKRLLPEGNRMGEKFVDEADLCREAAAYVAKNGIERIYPGKTLIAWDGFYDFNPVQKSLVAKLSRRAAKSVFMVELPGGSLDSGKRNGAYALAVDTVAFISGLGKVNVVENAGGECARPAAAANLFASATVRENGLPSGSPVEIIPLRSRAEEVKYIASRIAREAGAENAVPFSETMVVFPSLENYLPSVREIFPLYGIPYQCGAGEPLLSSPAVSIFMTLLDIADKNFPPDLVLQFLSSPFVSLENMTKDAAISWLDPFDMDAASRESGVGGGVEGEGIEEWISKLKNFLARAEKREEGAGAEGKERVARLREKMEGYMRCLDLLGEKFEHLSGGEKISIEKYFHELEEALEYFEFEKNAYESGGEREAGKGTAKAAARLYETFAECRAVLSLAGNDDGFTPQEYGAYLRAAIRGERYRPEGAGAGVQVAGLYETRGLSIKKLFLGGAVEGELPGKISRSFYLSNDDRKALGIASIRSDNTEQKMIFHRLVSTVEKFCVTYPERIGSTETVSSSFVERLRRDVETATTEPVEISQAPKTMRDLQIETGRALIDNGDAATAEELLETAAEGGGDKSFESLLQGCRVATERRGPTPGEYDGIIADAELAAVLKEKFLGGRHRFSASQVETYARCPFKYFCSRYVLGLDIPAEVQEDVDFAEAGTIIHRILMEFYSARGGERHGFSKRVTPDNFEAARAQMSEISEKVLAEYDMDGAFKKRFVENVTRGLRGESAGRAGILKGFLDRERELPAIVHPYMFEKEIPAPDSPDKTWRAKTSGGDVPFVGKIDRVDAAINPDGVLEYMVVDYKTGGSRADLNDTFNGIDFQLPLYLLLLSSVMEEKHMAVGATYDYLGGTDSMGRSVFMIRKTRTSTKGEDDAFMHVGARKKKGLLEDGEFDEKIDECADNLVKIVEALARGYFHTTGLSETAAGCSYCDFSGICKRDIEKTSEWLISAPGDGGPYAPGAIFKKERDEAD